MNATAPRQRFRIHDSAAGRSRIVRRVTTRDTVTTSRPDDIFTPPRARPAVLENIDPTFRADNRMEETQRRNAAFWATRPNAPRVPINKGDGNYDAYLATEATEDSPTVARSMGSLRGAL